MSDWMGEGQEARATAQFHIRAAKAVAGDVEFILASFDSTLAFLSSIGSGGQWGDVPFSKKPSAVSFIQSCVKDSEERGSRASSDRAGYSVYVAERRTDDGVMVRCGAAIVDYSLPDYVRDSEEVKEAVAGLSDFLYLDVLVTDRKTYPLARGVGEALIEHVKREAHRRRLSTVLVDCWNGNAGALASYYRKHGFCDIGEFSKMSKHVEGLPWNGCLLRCDLGPPHVQ